MTLGELVSRARARLFPDSETLALPMMDGAFRPNRALDDARVLCTVAGCDDVVCEAGGELLVTAGRQLLRVHPDESQRRRLVWEADADLLAVAAAGATVFVAVAGNGVIRLDDGAVTGRLQAVDGCPLRCVTALQVLPDGRLAITEGSRSNRAADWTRDLLERRAEGRVLLAAPDLSGAVTVARGLAWPAGILWQDDALWVSESWRHRVLAIPLSGAAHRTVRANLPGYPGRFARDDSGDVWLAVFALRTQLTEFVLRERRYCEEMLATIDPRYWVAPTLSPERHYLEPLQGGAIKKLGIVKPWAPPRSYGLVLCLSASGEIRASLHSRAGGIHHGITAVTCCGRQLLAVSRGSGRLLSPEAAPV